MNTLAPSGIRSLIRVRAAAALAWRVSRQMGAGMAVGREQASDAQADRLQGLTSSSFSFAVMVVKTRAAVARSSGGIAS
jgi:hypothetical protein